jgi:acyl-CoA thioesterase-1
LVAALVVLGVVVVLAVLTVGVVSLAFARLGRLPANTPESVALSPYSSTRVLVVGASTIHGNVSFNIVSELARRLGGYDFVNGGVNGSTTRQAIERSDAMLQCRPDLVIILIGGNDLLAIRRSPLSRRPADAPAVTIEGYREDLTELVELLRDGTEARVAVCTLPIAGERLDSAFNVDVDRMNDVIAEVAAGTGVALLPVNAAIRALLPSLDGRDVRDHPGIVVRGIVLHLGLGVPLTAIARLNGYRVLTDGLHLTPRAGSAAADELARFITAGEATA